MKVIVSLFALLVVAQTAQALDTYKIDCENTKGRFALGVSPQTHSLSFSDISYFGYAQILKDTAFGAQISPKKISFVYDWYYQAQYSLSFSSPIYNIGEQEVSLTFDDSDGASTYDETFRCIVSKD